MQIETRELGKQYRNGSWGLRGVTTTLRAGSFTALIGANGAGKTTLIHLLCGLLDPSEGSVLIPEGLELGWCSQHSVIDWYLSAYDNVLLGARFAGLKVKESHQRTRNALEEVRLSDIAHRPVDELSGGQQQRVQIARAMVHDPNLLILDEPTTGLDPKAAETLLASLRKRADAGATVLVSSHDLALLERYCDDVLLLDSGHMAAFEPRETFLQRFANEEVLRIEYEGELSVASIERIRLLASDVASVQPLELTVVRGLPLIEVLRLMEHVVVTDFKRQVPGLREAYMKLADAEVQGV